MGRQLWPPQLRFRLLASFAFILWGTILYTGYTVHRLLHEELPRFELQTITQAAHEIGSAIERDYATRGALAADALDVPTRLATRLYDARGRLIFATGSLPELSADVQQALAGDSRGARIVQHAEQRYGYQVLPLRSENQIVGVLEVSESLPPLDRFQETVRNEFTVAGIIAFFSILAVGMYLGGHLRWALSQIKQQTEAIVQGDFDRRIPVRGRDEIGQIGTYLNQMAEDLQRLAHTRNEFFSKVSHELRTPLTIAKGFTSMLSKRSLPPEQERTIRIIDGQIDDLARLVNDLLDLSRRQGSQLDLQAEELDCASLLAEAQERQRHALRPGIVLEADWKTDRVLVRGDRQRIHQIIGNLVGNAARYSKRRIVIDLDADAHDAILRVHDDGEGIAPEDLPRIFEPFFQAHRGPIGRTGLGLTVVRELVLAHKGTIDVASEPGCGTTFTVRLPRCEPDAPDEQRGWQRFYGLRSGKRATV